MNGLILVLIALAIMIICAVIYFVFLKNKETGANEDELMIESQAEKKEEEVLKD
jgi:uncharacterized protein YxeA